MNIYSVIVAALYIVLILVVYWKREEQLRNELKAKDLIIESLAKELQFILSDEYSSEQTIEQIIKNAGQMINAERVRLTNQVEIELIKIINLMAENIKKMEAKP